MAVFCFGAKSSPYGKFFKILITGSIARSASRRYLIYSEAIWRFFVQQRRHVAPIWVKFGIEAYQVSPPSVQRQGRRTPKTKIFTQIWPKYGI